MLSKSSVMMLAGHQYLVDFCQLDLLELSRCITAISPIRQPTNPTGSVHNYMADGLSLCRSGPSMWNSVLDNLRPSFYQRQLAFAEDVFVCDVQRIGHSTAVR